jgi:S1-C subfamily serine protease
VTDKPKKPRKKRTPAPGVPQRDSAPQIDSAPVVESGQILESAPLPTIPDEVSAAFAAAAARAATADEDAQVAAANTARDSSPVIAASESVAHAPQPGGHAASPEPVAHAETMPTPAAVPVPVEASLAERVAAPLEVARTKPLALPAREPSLPTFDTAAKPADAPAPVEVAASKPIEIVADVPTGVVEMGVELPPERSPLRSAKLTEKLEPNATSEKLAAEPPARPSADKLASEPTARPSAGKLASEPTARPSADKLAAEPGAVPLVPMPPVLPSPAEAALEAARIVSQMVDIDSESGAVIAAAAAAGAAIEAAVAAQKAAAAGPIVGVVAPKAAPASSPPGTSSPPPSEPPGSTPPALSELAASQNDPVTTVRLSRDRILRALAEEAAPADGAGGPRQPRARTEPGLPRDSAPVIPTRARTEPGIEGDEYAEFDPVAIAAAAIGRLRQRARTDLAELRVHYHRHDLLVILLAFVIIVAAGRIHTKLVTPPHKKFDQHGLVFEHPAGWLVTDGVPLPAPRLVHEELSPDKDDTVYHAELTESGGGTGKLEVLIDRKPAWSNIVTGLELERRTRWGELYHLDDSSVRSIAGHDWLRTSYRYAHAEKNDVPRVDHAIEYATIDRDQLYVITAFGTPGELDRVEDVVAPSLRVQSQTGLPLVPQTSRVSQGKYPTNVARAFDSTVMVVVADFENGRLRAKGGGSGVIVGADGSILTNYHVIHDKENRLHEIFVIGRFSKPDEAPQLQCAGRPNRSKLQPELDLALIKCDTDLDGRTWNPATAMGVWATLAEAKASDVKMGQRLFVLGYPDVGGGGLTLSEGEVEGWTGEDGTQGRDFIKTDASITHGNSGGPVVDDQGRLVGIASAFRTKVAANGNIIQTAQIGLVRPLGAASDLLAIATAGWTPRQGHTDVELTPTAVEAAAEGVRIYTTVLDDATEEPIRDALVMVLKPGVNSSTLDMNRLDDQTIAWGKTNGAGEVRLKQLVPPGQYTVMVIAPGYEPLIGENELHLDAKTPASFDPWGKITLRSR